MNKAGLNDMQFLKLDQVKERVALSRTAIYGAMECGNFPKPYSLGQLSKRGTKEGGHAVRWLASDIERWMRSRPKQEVSQAQTTEKS